MSASLPFRGREELEAENARLEAENATLRARLAEAEQTIEAIQGGKVDALVIDGADGQRIFSLTGAERPYRALIEQMAEGALTLGRDGSIRYCNRSFANLLSRPLETLFGRMLDEHVPDEDRAHLASLLRQAERTGARGEIRLLTPEGRAVPVFMSLTLLPDGGDPSIAIVVTDLTERKQAERASSSARFVRGLLDQAPLGIAVMDENSHYVMANPVYRALADGRLRVGRTMDDASAPAIVRTMAPLVAQVFESGRPLTVPECPIVEREDSWWKLNLVPLLDGEERVTSVLMLTEEVTERKRAEDALRLSERLLKDADRRKDEFLATLAHELRNPLAPIRTAAQILASPKLNAQQMQWAQTVIQRQVGHMALLLDDLLDVARITQGKLKLKIGPVALNDVVNAAVEIARPLLDARNHTLVVSLPATAVILDVDTLRLSQIIANLLTNAAKYTDPAGHVELTGVVMGRELCLSVKDDGIGIPPEARSRIFEMFSQVDTALGRSEGGLGIGLALVKGLVVLHGGTVEVRSAGVGAGSEFTVRLPLPARRPS